MVSLIFAMMPDAEAAGVIEGEFKLGEVLDESILQQQSYLPGLGQQHCFNPQQ